MKPIKPGEAYKKKLKGIPHEIIEAVNELIVENLDCYNTATVTQDEILNRLKTNGFPDTDKIFDRGWLDIEPIFRRAGWRVEFDKPAYCETYSAYFKFQKSSAIRDALEILRDL